VPQPSRPRVCSAPSCCPRAPTGRTNARFPRLRSRTSRRWISGAVGTCWPTSRRSLARSILCSGKSTGDKPKRSYSQDVGKDLKACRSDSEVAALRAELDEVRALYIELRAASLARQHAEAELRELYRERSIQRAQAAERDPAAALN